MFGGQISIASVFRTKHNTYGLNPKRRPKAVKRQSNDWGLTSWGRMMVLLIVLLAAILTLAFWATHTGSKPQSKVGGVWEDKYQGEIHVFLRAYPVSDNAKVDHVNVTMYQPGHVPWTVVAKLTSPTNGDEYETKFNPGDFGAVAGLMNLSFDDYPASDETLPGGNHAPNGIRTILWKP